VPSPDPFSRVNAIAGMPNRLRTAVVVTPTNVALLEREFMFFAFIEFLKIK
jgi:hypothetical protein